MVCIWYEKENTYLLPCPKQLQKLKLDNRKDESDIPHQALFISMWSCRNGANSYKTSEAWNGIFYTVSLACLIECLKLYQQKQQCYSQYFQIDMSLDTNCSWVPFSFIYPWTFYPIKTQSDQVKHNRSHQIISTQQPF